MGTRTRDVVNQYWFQVCRGGREMPIFAQVSLNDTEFEDRNLVFHEIILTEHLTPDICGTWVPYCGTRVPH
jgi:hypothetical protein